MTALENYVAEYGPEAGPKIYHIARSRAAYKGVSTRRRRRIAALTGRPYRVRRKSSPARDQGMLPLAGLAVYRGQDAESDRAVAARAEDASGCRPGRDRIESGG